MTKIHFDPFNHLPESYTNHWFVFRHGLSEANEQCIIASKPMNANHQYGLTERGREEVRSSVQQAAEKLLRNGPPLLVCSPLLRTKETAAIAAEELAVEPQIDDRLLERNFGDLELLPASHYEKVWTLDEEAPDKIPWKVESVYEVMDRATRLVQELEQRNESRTFILVTHCDTAMILTCAFRNLRPGNHRRLDAIRTGEIRQLNRVNKAFQS